jgi:hypothetical protein
MAGPADREKQKGGRRSAAAARATAAAAGALTPDLVSTIHEFVLPQLMLAQASQALAVSSRGEARTPPTGAEIQKLASLVLDGDLAGAHSFVTSLVHEGMSPQSALLLLVAPAARMLQADWLAEDCTFAEVAAALGLIHQLVSALAQSPVSTRTEKSSGEKLRT